MPCYKDEQRNTYYVKLYYTDWTGERKQKLKRGFKLQREAKEWERDFLERQQGTPEMTMGTLIGIYMEDMAPRLKESSMVAKRRIINQWILPYFKDKPISDISAANLRQWQSMVLESRNKHGEPYSPCYIKGIDSQITAILNYAVRFYGLPRNPHLQTGAIGKITNRVQFWTKDEFDQFIKAITDQQLTVIFYTFFYTGLRLGELQALTRNDIDFDKCTISVSKTYSRRGGKDIITTPKTANSVRLVIIPAFLRDMLQNYTNRLYGCRGHDRVFSCQRTRLHLAMHKACIAQELKHIPVHGLRHSHVSLLIDMGFTTLLVAERIGDTVEMVNRTYGHLYPNRHSDVSDRLQELVSN